MDRLANLARTDFVAAIEHGLDARTAVDTIAAGWAARGEQLLGRPVDARHAVNFITNVIVGDMADVAAR